MTPSCALVVFARPPALGRVKTRMEARFGPEEVLELYRAMLLDTLELARSVRNRFPSVVIYWAPEERARDSEREAAFASAQQRVQQGSDLGERMYNALSDELARGHDRVVLIGCDSPDLPPEVLLEAFDRLDEVDYVLGPADDGGYYLVGSRRALREPFTGIDWSRPTVLDETVARLERFAVRFALLRRWYDLDRPEDLDRLAQTGTGAPNVRRWLRERRV